MKHRLCLNCGIEISSFKSLVHNKCCSYKCDCEYEEKVKKEEHAYWVKYHEENSIRKMNSSMGVYTEENSSINNPQIEEDDDCNDSFEVVDTAQESIDDFYGFCLTDDNKDDDYNF